MPSRSISTASIEPGDDFKSNTWFPFAKRARPTSKPVIRLTRVGLNGAADLVVEHVHVRGPRRLQPRAQSPPSNSPISLHLGIHDTLIPLKILLHTICNLAGRAVSLNSTQLQEGELWEKCTTLTQTELHDGCTESVWCAYAHRIQKGEQHQ